MAGVYLFGRFIPFYGCLVALGLIVSTAVAYCLVKKYALSDDELLILGAYAICGGLLGAKALSIFLLRDQIEWDHLTSLSYLKQLLASGYVFYGGLLCGLTAFFAAGKIHKINARKYAEIIVPCVPLAHGFGRIGCHIAGCCYGIPYDGIGSIVYHAPAYAPIGVPLFPVQLLEAFINFSLAAIFLYMVLRGKRLREMPYIYLGTYAILRFLLEFL